MGVSIYKGDAASIQSRPTISTGGSSQEIFLGHVLAVSCEDATLGAILVKLLDVDRKSDDQISRVALPADLNILKYPLPGELVFVFNGIGSNTIKDVIGTQLYYFRNIASDGSITFNSNPYYSTLETRKSIREATKDLYEVRFENRIKNIGSFKKAWPLKEVIQKQPIRPFEGDFILQSRFGSSIRLGSTVQESPESPWSTKGGIAGDAISVVSVHKSRGSETRIEDINKDNSSIYMCQSQTIPVILSTSKTLKTHLYTYDLNNINTEKLDSNNFMQTPISEFYRENRFEETPNDPPAGGSPGPSTPSGGADDSVNKHLYLELGKTTPAKSEYLFGAPIEKISTADGKPARLPKSAAHGGRKDVKDNWPSNNAWDIHVAIKTPVYSVVNGVVQSVVFSYNPPFIWGYQVKVGTSGRAAFYTHLDHSVVKQGNAISKGDLIGFVGWFKGHDFNERFHHLHLGLWWGGKYKDDKVSPPGPWSARLDDFVDYTGKIL